GPSGFRHGQPAAIGLEAPFQHPGRLVLLRRDKADRIFGESLRGLLGFDNGLESISILVDVDPPDAVDRLLYGWHSILRSRFQGPRWIKVESLVRCTRETSLERFKLCFFAL